MSLGICVWLRGLYRAQRALSKVMEEIKLYALHHYDLQLFPRYKDRVGPYYHRKLLLMWQWHLILAKLALVVLVAVCVFHDLVRLKKILLPPVLLSEGSACSMVSKQWIQQHFLNIRARK